MLTDDGESYFIQPSSTGDVTPANDRHVLFSGADVIPVENRICAAAGYEHALDRSDTTPAVDYAGSPGPTEVMVAEIAVDADYEYFQLHGSIAAVQARVESVLNTVNVQYERDVGIRLLLGTLVVRDTSNDPYTTSTSSVLLGQLANEWFNNQGDVGRDLVHLFTEKNLTSNIIGVAYLGTVCNPAYNFGLSQVDFSANIESSADLVAHEIGHNFGAGHCSCPQNTMSPSVRSSNAFHDTFTVPTIEAFRDSVACLETAGLDDTTLPTVTIVDPDGGDVAAGSIAVTVSAADDSGITRVEFFVDSDTTPVSSDTDAPFTTTIDVTALADGTHTFTAVAIDSSLNQNQASDAVDVNVVQSTAADPGFPYVDADGDGQFYLPDGDVALSVGMLTDGVFDTRRSESGYTAIRGADLVVPASVVTVSSSAAKGLVLWADGDIVIGTSLVASSSAASIVLRSRSGGVTLQNSGSASTLVATAPKKVVIRAKNGPVVAGHVDFTSAIVVIKTGSTLDLHDCDIDVTNSVVLVARGTVLLDRSAVATSGTKSKVVVKATAVDWIGSDLTSPKIVVRSSTDLDARDCRFLACSTASGKVTCTSKTDADFTDSSLLAGRRVTLKTGDTDLTNAVLANTNSAGRVIVKAGTVTVGGATLLDGSSSAPVLKCTVVGTPLVLGSGTQTCH